MVKKQSLILLLLTLLLGAGCRDPIFYKISREVKPREPRIKGVPTKFVVHTTSTSEDFMYVAAASLHRYRNGSWDWGTWAKPPGKVFDLAASGKYLYALTNPERPAVYRSNEDVTVWELLGGYSGSPQSIYGEIGADGKPVSGGKVFVGVRQGDPTSDGIDYAIYYADDTDSTFQPLDMGGKTGLLTGAVLDGSNHFLSTNGRGVYSWNGAASTQAVPVEKIDPNLVGIIRTGDTSAKVFAFSRSGNIYEVTASGGTPRGGASSKLTGAVALWRPNPSMGEGKILLGIRDGSNYGYEEVGFYLSGGDLVSGAAHKPGTSAPSSVEDASLFDTTLRPHPVNHIFQVPSSVDPAMVLFAAVQGTGATTNDIDSGVWSYRRRDGTWQWNAEE
jgi:hypothetical protein